ncbi:MAG: hypothetical protein ABW185_07910 [Sedimenticola sp.]
MKSIKTEAFDKLRTLSNCDTLTVKIAVGINDLTELFYNKNGEKELKR